MKKILTMAILSMGLLLACSGKAQPTSATENKPQVEKGEGKTLVVYFSHAGENYNVGNIKVGNTKRVAEAIKELTGADLFEIVAEKSYDMPYRPLTELAKKEAEDGEFPAFKGKIDNLDQYTTVYIGGPIWWGTYPRVMFTFFRDNDLNGKTLIPFSTHEGSGMGNIQADVEEAYPKANVLDGFCIRGTECQKKDIKNKVAKLIKDYSK